MSKLAAKSLLFSQDLNAPQMAPPLPYPGCVCPLRRMVAMASLLKDCRREKPVWLPTPAGLHSPSGYEQIDKAT